MNEFGPYPVRVLVGTLALSPVPGRTGSFAADLAALLGWGPDMVLTMCTGAELDRSGAGSLGRDMAAHGIAWAHLPVADFGAPGAEIAAAWPGVSARALDILAGGGRVLVHCFGGCGRSGMAALRLMVETGEAPEAALARLRAVRPCAVETEAQLEWAATGRAG